MRFNKAATADAIPAMIGPASISNLPLASVPILNVALFAFWKVDLINGIKTEPTTKHKKPNVTKQRTKPCCFLLLKKTLKNVNKPPAKTRI